jgi:alanyl-tRNA synthetase
MEKLGLNEIRKMFRDFYVSKGHYPGKSASLIPKNDKSLLIINSGMAPLKPYFLGVETPPKNRMTTCQKCIRTDDIDNVGITARHGTFFEMMGNFSFGDYFKEESLNWGWEFLTKELKIPEDKLWATVYQDDDEAVEIWKKIGMPEERIVRLGKDDNFWEIGLGPCGPCSEIYYDRGPEFGCGKPDCKPGCDCDRYMEVWNHVFSQFDKQEDGSYKPMEHPNIDTGMGLERIACVMQGTDSIFDVDTIRHILNAVVEMSGVPYEAGNRKNDISIRIVTDHLRSMVFMIADGILPSNESRGYVLRRMIRRASRHGRMLGIEGRFLATLADKVIEISGEAYPEIVQQQDYIKRVITTEESKFEETLEQGTEMINRSIEELKAEGKTVMNGAEAFKLYDTYGFPIELTEEILADAGMTADVDGFHKHMEEQKERARAGQKDTSGEAWKEKALPKDLPDTVFTGYDELQSEAEIKALYTDGEAADSVKAGESADVYLDRTPFYAESGGQEYDTGIIRCGDNVMQVLNVQKKNGLFRHEVRVQQGSFKKGERVYASVDAARRHAGARNHSATHLLQKALQEVLGDHVKQAGSKNNAEELRFDFTHFEPMTQEELKKTEDLVNEKILAFLPVNTEVLPIEEAKKKHAMMLFDSKYGDEVRVVSMGDWSVEFCAGTHVPNTGMIGAFHILSESGVASGVRRIEAVTGTGVLRKAEEMETVVQETSDILKTKPEGLVKRAGEFMDAYKAAEHELDAMKKEQMGSGADELLKKAKDINGVKLVTGKLDGASIDDLRTAADQIRESGESAVMVLASVSDGKVTMVVGVTDDLTDRFHAGKLIKPIAKEVKGGGGGKADLAQAGGKDPSGLENAFKTAEALIS